MRRFRNILALLQLIILSGNVLAQDTARARISGGFEGQLAVTTNGRAVFANMGGPCLKLAFRRVAFGVSMFPSLKFEQDATKSVLSPILGVGPQVYLFRKKVALCFPFYYLASKNSWIGTVGIGYVFTKSKG